MGEGNQVRRVVGKLTGSSVIRLILRRNFFVADNFAPTSCFRCQKLLRIARVVACGEILMHIAVIIAAAYPSRADTAQWKFPRMNVRVDQARRHDAVAAVDQDVGAFGIAHLGVHRDYGGVLDERAGMDIPMETLVMIYDN